MNKNFLSARDTLRRYYPQGEADAITFLLFEQRYALTRNDLYMGKGSSFSDSEEIELENILSRLSNYEPLQYVLGETNFCSMSFNVAPGVLIPRPETEELVAWVCEENSQSNSSILDIGTGSGCIAISLAKKIEGAHVTAWDVSHQALEIAKSNATKLGAKIDVFEQNIVADNLPKQVWDVIVSNPPYVKESERLEMDKNVLRHEPDLALFVPDSDPLLFYRKIADYGLLTLSKGGKLYFEINSALGEEMVELLVDKGYRDVLLRKDTFGLDRMIRAIK